jgi:hypothetical protein
MRFLNPKGNLCAANLALITNGGSVPATHKEMEGAMED